MPGLLDKLIPSELVSQIVAAVDKHLPVPVDQAKKMELEAAIEQALISAQAAQNQAQAEINKTEAASPKLFIAGWRPFIGWTCAAAILYSFLIYPILKAFWPAAVVVDIESLWPIIIGMLGLGGLRTFEKTQRVQDKH